MAELIPAGKHSPLGPSSAERWINCPGSVAASRGIPDKSSIFSAEGTVAHHVSHACRLQDCDAGKLIGHEFVSGEHRVTVDGEMADGVNVFNDWCDEVPGDAFHEVLVGYDQWVPEGFGTADDIRIDAETARCTVTDFKYGKGVQVFAENNTQLMIYALGVLHDFGPMYDIREFDLRICQPRLDHKDSWPIGVNALLHWAREILVPAAVTAMMPDAPFAAGSWCQFCRIKGTCKTRAAFIMQQVAGSHEDFSNLDEDLDVTAFNPSDAASMSNDQLARAWHLVDTIKRWCTDIEAQVMRKIQSGDTVGDIKLVEGRSTRVWADGAADALLDRFPEIDEEALWERKLLSVKKVEDLVGKKKFNADAGDLVDKPPGKPKLAPGSDRRPAMTASALADFDVLEDDEE